MKTRQTKFKTTEVRVLSIVPTSIRHIDWSILPNIEVSTKNSKLFLLEPAKIVLGFEFETAVYFLLRETQEEKLGSASAGSFRSGSQVSRLIRICKGDQGGLKPIADEYFGTFAKADLTCQAEVVKGSRKFTFPYSYVTAAHWDEQAQRLYATFSAGM